MINFHKVKYDKEPMKKIGKLVLHYQEKRGNKKKVIKKLIKNYEPFCSRWARAFSPYLDDDVKAGESLYHEIILKALFVFKPQGDHVVGPFSDVNPIYNKSNVGRRFNAYLVSCLLNKLKNIRNAKESDLHRICLKKGVKVDATYRPRQKVQNTCGICSQKTSSGRI